MSFDRIPAELKNINQWVTWRLINVEGSSKPTKPPYNAKTGKLASVSDPNTWTDFGTARIAVSDNYSGIGFVFTDSDDYTIIDLDDTKGDEVATTRQMLIYQEMDSYAEISPSGKGLHIIVRGRVPSGRRRANIEVYSTGRYATFTGNVYNDKPIAERQDQLTALWEQMGAGSAPELTIAKGDLNEKYTDEEIIQQAKAAINGDKFTKIFNGFWQDFYPSQSEADYSVLNIIAFYTQNKSQIKRIFRNCALGKRAKAKREDYLSQMIDKSLDRDLPTIDIDGLTNALEDKIANQIKPQIKSTSNVVPINEDVVINSVEQIQYNPVVLPPGLMGEIAQFIYQASPLPVPEIALAASIGLMAGICGRAYNVSNTGLNQYVLMLAKTGMGKEAMRAGIDKLMNEVKFKCPTSQSFIGPRHIASGQALIKYVHKKSQCFVSVLGEFGLTLQRISSEHASQHDIMLKQILLELYNVSGHTDMFQPSIQADLDKNNQEATSSPAFSLLGESTPHSFYAALSEDMIAEGLLPRFMFINYNGDRQNLNKNANNVVPPIFLIEKFASLIENVEKIIHERTVINVQLTEEAEKISDAFAYMATNKINRTSDEVILNLWNRAHLKSLKLAALIAVGVNMWAPIITKEHLDIAMNMVQNDIRSLTAKFEAGEIGHHSSDSKQQVDMIRIIKDYVIKDWDTVKIYCNSEKSQNLHLRKIIPYGYISRRLIATSAYRLDRLGSTNAIKRSVQHLIDTDKLRELNLSDKQKLGTTQRLFVVSDPNLLD